MSINVVDVGTPPDGMDDWTATVVRFHGFADLTTTRDEYVISPLFSCLAHQWRLDIYPGGEEESDEGYVALEIANMSNTSIKIDWGFSVRDADGKEAVKFEPDTDVFDSLSNSPKNGWYKPNFAKRSKLLNILVNGSLVIEVRMKPTSIDKSITQFVPTNPFNKKVPKLYMDEESADVVFEVGKQPQTKGKRKRTKSSTTSFHAHRPILQVCARTLYEMCGAANREGITTVSITDVEPNVFGYMLFYAYGGKLLEDELNNNAKDIIHACDKYGVVHLKLEAEACYVKSTEITIDNMMDNLLYADSKNLALLKEAVMDFIIKNKHSIIGKVSFDNVPGGTCTDILTAMARGEEQTGDDGEEDESAKYNKMRVGTLRKMLDEKELDVDGSREAMIALLKEHDSDDDDDNGEDGVGE